MVYDVTRKDTFDSIESWFKEIIEVSKTISLILVGNKIDLVDDRVISTKDGEELAKKLNLSYIETSAKTGENINDAFKMLALQIIKQFVFTEEIN